MDIQIAFYSVIFLLAVVGNILVIVTLIQNKRMRTVTNVFLLSLAISDLLLAVFCMPFTLVPVLLRNFIFGAVMCVLIRYLQGIYFIDSLHLIQRDNTFSKNRDVTNFIFLYDIFKITQHNFLK
ncbi:hypothetical protein SNE40_016112 [Patella caerulea]|uniref:G-protein coupled receptors family 1 profile domain-containing protein n=1 Tax=Patella caerulea TaxID=87958 RepID=A0AAN8J858_PATCE